MRLPRRQRKQLPAGGLGVNLAAIAEANSVGVNFAVLGLLDATEAEFQAAVVQVARQGGWDVLHNPDSRLVTATGFPDLTCKRKRDGRREVIVAELKRRGEKPRPDQWEWLWAFEECGVRSFFWTPENWSEIQEVLK